MRRKRSSDTVPVFPDRHSHAADEYGGTASSSDDSHVHSAAASRRP